MDRERVAARILELSSADQTEVLVSTGDAALMRFTHEAPNQNVVSTDAVVSVRAILGGKTGVAQTNRLDDASLRAVVERAAELAALAPNDPLQGLLPAGVPLPAPAGAYNDETANASAERRGDMCEAIFQRAQNAGCWTAGFSATSVSGLTVANSAGAHSSFDRTDASLNVKMNALDSTGFAEAYSTAVGNLDAAAVAHIAAEKARAGAHPRAVNPGAWTVILEPAAFGELFYYISDHFSAQSYDDGSSFCSGGLDQTYFSESVTIRDDFAHPLAPGMPFDFEGYPTQRVTLVEHGVVRSIVTDSYYARKLDRPNTGHALPAPNAYGPQPRNLVIAGGSKSVAQLIAQTERGLLVTRFWYIRTVDRKRAIVTGMTRDGTFLIDRGRLTHGVHNMRFNASILDVLQRCEFSAEQTRTGGYQFSLVAPTAKIENFTFSSVTEF